MFFFIAMFLQSAWAWATPVVSSVIGASTAATIAQTLRVITLVAMLGSLQRKSVESTGQELTLTTDPNAGVPIAFGERMDAGTLVFRKTYTGGVNDAEANQILTMIKVISGGGVIDGYVNTTFTANVVDTAWNSGDAGGTSIVKPTWSVDPVATSGPERRLSPLTSVSPDTDQVFVYGGNYAQFRSRGDITQNLTDVAYYNPQVWADCGDQFKFTGFAYVVEVLKNNNTTFPQGVPNTTFLSRGLRWFDPRNEACVWEEPNTYVYSTNGPIIAYNLIRGRLEYQADGTVVDSFGLGVPISLIDEDSFIAAANLADTYGLTVHGRPLTTDSMIKILDMIMSCSGGFLTSNGAMISCFIYSPKTVVMALTDADLVGDFTVPFSPSYRDRLNSVIPSYPEPLQNWGTWIGNAIQQQQYIDEDGELKQTTLNLDYTTNLDSASWLAGLELVNSREMLSPEIVCGLRTVALQTGDAITFESDANNIEQFKFLVIQREIDLSTMTVKLKLQSENDEKYAWLEGLTSTPPSSASVAGIDWTTAIPPDADNWTVAPSLDANQVPDILITGNVASIPSSIVQARFSYKISTDDTFTFSGSVPIAGNISDDVKYTISGLQPATSYDVQIGFVSSLGVISQGITFADVITSELVASDTLNVAGSNAVTLVNSVVTAFTLANNAVIQTAVLADQMTANNMVLANSIAQSTTDAASALAQQASDINNTIATTAATLTSQIDGVAANLLSNATQIYTEINALQSNVATMNGVIESISANATSALAIQLVGGYTGNSIGSLTSGLLYQANQLRVTGDSALGNSITALQTSLANTNANVALMATITALNAVESNITATQNSVTSLASQTTLLQNEVNTVQNGVANAATVTALTQTNANVATLGNTVTAQGSLISGLQTTVGGLASSAALSSLASNVTTLAGEVTSNAAALTALQGTVAGKADSSALSSLSSTVSSLQSGLTSNAAAITALSAKTNNPNPNIVRNSTFALGSQYWQTGNYAQYVTAWNPDIGYYIASPYASVAIYSDAFSIGAGETYTLSATFGGYGGNSYGSGSAPVIGVRCFSDSAGNTQIGSDPIVISAHTTADGYYYFSAHGVMPSGTVTARVYLYTGSSMGGNTGVWYKIKLEVGSTATAWADDNTYGPSQLATASALSSLSATVSSTNGNLSSLTSSVTNLTASAIGPRPNLLYNPTFAVGFDGWNGPTNQYSNNQGIGDVGWYAATSGTGDLIYANPITIAGSNWYSLSGIYGGGSSSNWTSAPYIGVQFYDASNNNLLELNTFASSPAANSGYKYCSISGVAPSAATWARVFCYSNVPNGTVLFSKMKFEIGSFPTSYTDDATPNGIASKASASALSSLAATVASQGSTLSSQSASVTSLQNQIGTGSANLIYNTDWQSLPTNGTSSPPDGWGGGFDNTGQTVTRGVNITPSYYGIRNVMTTAVSGYPASSTVFDTWNTFNSGAQYWIPCNAGDVIFASALLAYHRAGGSDVGVLFMNSAGTEVGESHSVGGGVYGGGNNGDPANFQRVGQFCVAPAGTSYCGFFVRTYCDSESATSGNPYNFMCEPMLSKAVSGQTNWPPYAAGSASGATAYNINTMQSTVTSQGSTLSATASTVSSLSSTVSGHTATISSIQSTVNGISAKAGVVLDVNGWMTGWTLNNNGSSGSMNILADTLSIQSYNTARTVFSAGCWEIYDSSNVMRVRMGVW